MVIYMYVHVSDFVPPFQLSDLDFWQSFSFIYSSFGYHSLLLSRIEQGMIDYK
jgi:hypothetical protein